MAKDYGTYSYSQAVLDALEALQQQSEKKPGAYRSSWKDQIDAAMAQLLNRDSFSYDVSDDPLYRQYRDQYDNLGRRAMLDTLAQGSALTGGYGNSWTQSAAQQRYGSYMQELTGLIPELYQLAMDRYRLEGDTLQRNYDLLQGAEDRDYDRYRDGVADWTAEQDQLRSAFENEREFDFDSWTDNRDFTYQQERDDVADAQWQAEFDEAVRQFNARYGGRGSGGGGPRKKEEEPAEESMDNDRHTRTGQQNIKSEMNKAINAAKDNGTITAKQAQQIKSRYKGLTV